MSARRLLFWLYAAVVVAYAVWRGTSTLSQEHPVFGGVFYAAELLSIISSMVFYAILSSRTRTDSAPAPPRAASVDVFIATYNEDLDLVRSTAVAARDMDHPHKTWICDDGRRSEMRQLARDLGIGYLSRLKNEDFKAGNLNRALKNTDGEFIVVVDADHVLAKNFLTSLLGYFESDPDLALVQIPQVYYNIDSYQHALPRRRQMPWHEASQFHHGMQPGTDGHGAAFFVGTGAVLRRTALQGVGGFATGSITEDIHTSMRLHAAGYHSRYVDRPLGYLLAPETPLAYACQRLRWTQGAMQILRSEPVLWRRGLKPWQRLSYFNSLLGYLAAYQHLVFYLVPGIFLYTGVSPISFDPQRGFPIFLSYVAFTLAFYKLAAAPHARLLVGECYKMLNLAIHIRGSISLLWPRGLSFRVTPKGEHRGLPLFLILPALILFLFNITAVGAGIVQIGRGAISVGPLIFATAICSFFSAAGALALLHALERRGHTEPFAFPVSLPCPILNAAGAEVGSAELRRLNHRVAYLTTEQRLADDEVHALDLRGAGLDRPIRATVRGWQRTRELAASRQVVKLGLEGMSSGERDLLNRYLFERAVPEFFRSFESAEGLEAETRTSADEAFDFSNRSFLPVRSAML